MGAPRPTKGSRSTKLRSIGLSLGGILVVLIVASVAFGVRLIRSDQAGPAASPTPAVQASSPSPSPTTALSSSPCPSPTGEWKVYTDPQFGFSISYPPDFIVEEPPGGPLPRGILFARRAVNCAYAGGFYPPVQIDFHVFAKDADTLTAWVQKHGGPCGPPGDVTRYWQTASNLTSTTVAGIDALSFDETLCGTGITPHNTVFFIGPSYVFSLDWFPTRPEHVAAARQIGQQVLASFRR
jgi:hypothetical protein